MLSMHHEETEFAESNSTTNNHEDRPNSPINWTNPKFRGNEAKYLELRQSYCTLSEDIQKYNDESGDAGVPIEDLVKTVDRADEIFSEVKRTREERLDAKCLKKIAFLGRSTIEKTQVSLLKFNPSEYADKLIQYMNDTVAADTDSDEEEDQDVGLNFTETSIKCLCKELFTLSSTTFGMEPLFGAMDWKPPERKKSTMSQPERASQKIKSDRVNKVTSSTTNEETQLGEVKRIHNCLKEQFRLKKQPIIFLQFIMDPKSFSNTIENMFHVSFLVRDGHAKICCDKSKIPTIAPCSSKGSSTSDGPPNNQAVMNMNVSYWKEAIDLLDLQGIAPMIPAKINHSKRRSQVL